jgi:hypothetical protein
MKNDPYVPVMHTHWTDHWRVPMWVDSELYRVCLGQNYYRHYTDDTLPTVLKSAFSMINAFPPNDVPIWEIDPITAYINKQDEQLNTIGWRVNKHLYMIILSGEQMGDLNG